MGLLGYQLPPGFRFHPTDQELIIEYLSKKLASSLSSFESIIADVDIYKHNPWDLPEKAFFGEGEWFFFSPRDRKYPNGARPNRAAASGYWKATGTDKPILAAGGSKCLGVKKALVFYEGRAPKGTKTDWLMHEYRLLDSNSVCSQKRKEGTMRLDDWVLCRVRRKCNLPLQEEDVQLSSIPSHKKATQAQPPDHREEANNEFRHSKSNTDEGYGLDQAQPLQQVLDNIKRNLSFSALDELLMSPPHKKLNCFGVHGDQFFPSESNSADVYFPNFLL